MRRVQGNGTQVRRVHVQTHLTTQSARYKPFALDMDLQIEIALQPCLVPQRRQVHMGQLQVAAIAPWRGPGIDLSMQVEMTALSPELAPHRQGLRRPCRGE